MLLPLLIQNLQSVVTMTASAASVAVTGQAVNWRTRMAVTAATVAVTGQDVNWQVKRTADPAAIAVTGQDVNWQVKRTADPAAIAVTGQDVSLHLPNRILSAEAASVAVTGQTTTSRRVYYMSAAAAVIALIGQSVIFDQGLSASAAAIAVTGQTVTLTKIVAAPMLAPFTVAVTGQDATLTPPNVIRNAKTSLEALSLTDVTDGTYAAKVSIEALLRTLSPTPGAYTAKTSLEVLFLRGFNMTVDTQAQVTVTGQTVSGLYGGLTLRRIARMACICVSFSHPQLSCWITRDPTQPDWITRENDDIDWTTVPPDTLGWTPTVPEDAVPAPHSDDCGCCDCTNEDGTPSNGRGPITRLADAPAIAMAITGQTVALTADISTGGTMPAAAAAITVTGEDTELTVTHYTGGTLAAEASAIAVMGKDNSAKHQRPVTAAALAITGKAINWKVIRGAGAAIAAATGQAVTLTATISNSGSGVDDGMNVSFGERTMAGAGGYPLPGGATSIASQTATAYRVVAGKLVPLTVMTPGGIGQTGTVTLNTGRVLTLTTVPNARSAATSVELQAIIALGIATVSGSKALLRTGQYDGFGTGNAYFKNKAFTSSFTIKSHYPGAPANFGQIDIVNSNNLVFDSIKVSHVPQNNFTLVNPRGPCRGTKLVNCDIGGTTVINTADPAFSAGWFKNFNGINTGNSGGYPVDITVENCNIHDVTVAINLNCTGAITLTGPDIRRFYEDGIKITQNAGGSGPIRISDPSIGDSFGKLTDTGSPHCDAIQFVGGASNSVARDWTDIILERVRVYRGPGRGETHGIFADDMLAGYFMTAIMNACIIETGAVRGITVSRADNCEVRSCTVGNNPFGVDAGVVQSIRLGESGSRGTQKVYDSVAEIITVYGSADIQNCAILGRDGVTIPYATAYVGPTWRTNTMADLTTMYAGKPGGPLDTASPKIGATAYANFTARTWANPRP